MNPEEQAAQTRTWVQDVAFNDAFAQAVHERIETAGGAQYYDELTDTMLFETMPLEDLEVYAREEVEDLAAYLWMLRERSSAQRIRCERLLRDVRDLWEKLT